MDHCSIKYVYVAGLEHSGTTLFAQLLASQAEVLAIGEVGQFLSKSHMQHYMATWGDYPDVTRCSCGEEWSRCPFWMSVMSLNGKFCEPETATGYGLLLDHISDTTRGRVIVDTSKSLAHLDALRKAWKLAKRPAEDLLVVVLAKDPRGFASSIQRKQVRTNSLLAVLRSMNWWNGVYRGLLEYKDSSEMRVVFVTYEQLCRSPTQVLEQLGNLMRRPFSSPADISHANSHIALGNKDFIERNRLQIVYDDAWKSSWRLRVAYAMNLPVRKTWRVLQAAESANVALSAQQ